ncbi:hypothetical protein BpHYR1_053406 [Brachionus plicatilis]|uniref:Uncharacterized protein n=1 Tax=Brachionus plicatilis TaxID=10195 RepID=A0A3M7RIL8_BRAPC|nr:hypothetical protein BpHYR1_053406 [Brachionus plicatilis]
MEIKTGYIKIIVEYYKNDYWGIRKIRTLENKKSKSSTHKTASSVLQNVLIQLTDISKNIKSKI